jgi:hypothetical protein
MPVGDRLPRWIDGIADTRCIAWFRGIDQKHHKLSVDSDSIGTKRSFSARCNQSMTPSLGFAALRISRYSPSVQTFNVEFLPALDAVALTKLGGRHNLSLRGPPFSYG